MTYIQGEIILKNNAAAPYPDGDDINFNPEFTGQLMKIVVVSPDRETSTSINEMPVKLGLNLKIDDI